MVIYASFASFADEFPKYQDKFNGLYSSVIGFLRIPHEEVQNYVENIRWTELWQKASLTRILGNTVGSFVNFIGNLFLVLLFTVYIVLGREHFLFKLRKAFDEKRTLKAYDVFINIHMGMQKYLVTKTLISLGTGIVATVVLLIFGVEFAFVWGLLAFVLNYIPAVGSPIATVPPILVAFFQFGSLFPAVWVALLLVLNQVAWGNIIEPRAMGKSLNLSPLVVIISLIFWGFIWGPVGMILAIPISAATQIICANIDALKPIAVFMGGD
jgi:predicted PurR-regulated permease PerM